MVEGTLRSAPAPVPTQGGGHVHAGLGAQTKEVLHLNDGEVCRACPDAAHHAPGLPLVLVELQVLAGKAHVARVCRGKPAERRVVVVRSHVRHTVVRVVVRLVAAPAAVARVEGELKDLHSRVARVGKELVDRLREEPKVLGHDIAGPNRFGQGAEELHAGAFAPAPPARVGGVRRNRVVGVEAAKMVDA